MRTTWYDTVATLGWLAASTSRVRLLSHVFVLAYRHPLVSAKSFATLDALSGGRVILGVGAGHLEAERARAHLGVVGDDLFERGLNGLRLEERRRVHGRRLGLDLAGHDARRRDEPNEGRTRSTRGPRVWAHAGGGRPKRSYRRASTPGGTRPATLPPLAATSRISVEDT